MFCEKCTRHKDEKYFYGTYNTEKYPTGKLNICKDCLCMHVDVYDSRTVIPILKELDMPYVPDEWYKLIQGAKNKNQKISGVGIMGRYAAKMHLKKWKDYRFKDSEFIEQMESNKIKDSMRAQGYDNQEIEKIINNRSFALDAPAPVPVPTEVQPQTEEYSSPFFPQEDEDEDEEEINLSKEERRALKVKWGKGYKDAEWVQLEQMYQDMISSYDIQTAGERNSLILLCKASLKANQLIDIGDVEGAQKMTRMYDGLMKSGKLTAAQNKIDGNDVVDSVGELVALCEADGFIPRYYIEKPNDKIDRVIQDMNKYTYDLVTGETGLSLLIENAIRGIEDEKKKIEDARILNKGTNKTSEQQEEDELFNYDTSYFFDTAAIAEEQQEIEEEEERLRKEEERLTYGEYVDFSDLQKEFMGGY